MKTSQDPRHQHRIQLMQQLFAYSFANQEVPADIEPIITQCADIDARIVQAAPEWPIEKIAKVDLAILRLAVYELTVTTKEPPKVIIDEAVELAKTYGNPASPSFVNGALGSVLQTHTKATQT